MLRISRSAHVRLFFADFRFGDFRFGDCRQARSPTRGGTVASTWKLSGIRSTEFLSVRICSFSYGWPRLLYVSGNQSFGSKAEPRP